MAADSSIASFRLTCVYNPENLRAHPMLVRLWCSCPRILEERVQICEDTVQSL